jgi:hypothetical protein
MSYSNCIYNKTKHPTWEYDIPQWNQNRHRWVRDYIRRLPGVKKASDDEGDTKFILTYEHVFQFFADIAFSAAELVNEFNDLSNECEEDNDAPANYLVRRITRKAAQADEFIMSILVEDDNPRLWLIDLEAVLAESDKSDEFIFVCG